VNKYAIIVAGGSGVRMGTGIPKQFISLDGKPVIYHTIQAFLDAFGDIEIILVLPQGHIDTGEEILKKYFPNVRIKIVTGGETRFHSVKNGLTEVKSDSVVFVHDGVRCLITAELIKECYKTALQKGSAIPAVASKDSIRLRKENKTEAFNRNNVLLIQTPQTFQSSILLKAFEVDYQENFTDEATVVEALGIDVSIVQGDENNIKITKLVDLLIAEKILQERRK